MDAVLWMWSPTRAVVDPGFPRGGRQPLSLSENLLFGKVFTKNCMKMKEIGPRGGIYAVQQKLDLNLLAVPYLLISGIHFLI